MVRESNQSVFLIQLDTSNFAEFEISEFEISRVNCICYICCRFAIVIVGSESSSRAIFDKLPRKEMHGQTPMVTHCNKQSLNNFEAQARKGEAPPQQNGKNPEFQV